MCLKRSALAALVGVLGVGCGSGSDTPANEVQIPAAIYSCGSGSLPPPPSKLITPTSGGVPGRYIVVLMDSVADVSAEASTLAARYDGTILYTYTAALRGFAVAMPDANAPALSQEASVCWVEQDGTGHLAVAPDAYASGS